MAFLHCEKCHWSQDDFWSKENWNPFRKDILDWLIKILHEGIDGSGRYVEMDIHWAVENKVPYIKDPISGFALIDFRKFLAFELERKAKNIRTMEWITYEEFKNDKNAKCPNCGSSEYFDID